MATPRIVIPAELRAEQLRKTKAEADLLELKASILRGQLLDRQAVFNGLSGIFTAIASIINASALSRRDKDDILKNISGYPLALQHVADRQAKDVGDPQEKKPKRAKQAPANA